MGRIFALTTCLVLAAVGAVAVAGEPDPGTLPNLARNPGFEEWPAKPEKGRDWGATGYSVGTEGRDGGPAGVSYRTGEGELDTERHSGKYAQYVQVTTWGRGAISAGIPVTVGNRYRVSVWTKILSGKFQLGVCFSHAPWTYLGDWVVSEPNARWTQVAKDVVIPPECRGIAVVMFNATGYLDDLEVVDLGKAEAPPAEDSMPLLAGRLASEITRRRLALFAEPGFPSESPRPIDWYEATLAAAGLRVTRLGWKALADDAQFNRERFDTLVLPTGGNFPSAAEKTVEQFLAKGGTLLVDESLVYRTTPAPDDDIRKELARRKQDYLDGKGGYAYFDYLAKHIWVPYGNLFHYDEKEEAWHSTIALCQNYEYINPATYPQGVGVRTWPNYAQASYARPFAEPLARHPDLASVLTGFPEAIPADEKPSAENGAIRLCRLGGGGADAAVAPERACDLLLPLYRFPAVSGRSYPAYPEAGKYDLDRDADFYVLRYHNARMQGGTLLHFGVAGAKLLRSPQGEAVLIQALRLAESELPGECPAEFVQTANRAREAFSAYSAASLRWREVLTAAAQLAHAAGQTTEVAARKAAFTREKQRFERFGSRADELELLLLKRDGGKAWGRQARAALATELEAESARLTREADALQAVVAPALQPPARVPVEHPFRHVYIGLDNTQGRGALGLDEFRRQVEALGLRYQGYNLTSYRHEYTFNSHAFKREFDSGVLDPATGVVRPVKYRWPETAEDRERWSESFRWQLERANTHPEIDSIFGLDESDFEWSLWGPRDRGLFLDYLKARYGDVRNLNDVWGTAHATFDDVQLPVAQPQTQSEHARWEDWTRFREVYRLEREVRLSTGTVARYAPDRLWRYFTWETYNQHASHPANGINFYEYGKELKVNGFEHSNEDNKEWLAFDICSQFSTHCTAEWGAMYFPPPGHQAQVDLLTERLWKGVANGQAGWCLFNFSSAAWGSARYVDLVNRFRPLGWQLAELNRRVGRLEHIILDGRRDEPPVRIVYSPTTRRHTSWPGGEGDISFRATAGLYTYFRNSHLHARAIDEQAVWEGHLAPACRLLILSEVLYENAALHAKVLEYLRNGGGVLVTPGSGRFDQYGRRRDSWLTLAGVTPCGVREKVVPLAEGVRYFSSAHADRMVGLVPVFAEEVRVLARYADGTAALTETPVGNGRLFVLGADLGLDCHDQWQANPATVDALLEPVLAAAGVLREFTCSPQEIMLRPWQYQGQRYLFLTSPGRDGLTDVALGILGAWDVRDYLLGMPLPARFDGTRTQVTCVVGSPGGAVLALTPAPAPARTAPPAAAVPPRPAAAPVAPPAAAPLKLDERTPFEGRLWARDGRIRLGEFALEIDVETGGGWGGRTYLVAQFGKERQRRLCTAKQETVFHFTDRVLRVACAEVVPVYPVNLLVRASVEEPAPVDAPCRLLREPYHGQDSLVLDNGLLRVRLLPKLGGRMIEFVSLPDGTPHTLPNPELIAKGVGGNWADFGGMEENAGGYPGPYWGAEFAPTVVSETADSVGVRLAMATPVEWAYGYAKPKSGRNRLVKEFSLKRGESRLEVRLQAFNEHTATMPTGLRTHPVWQIGGDGDPADRWVLRTGGQQLVKAFPFSGEYPAEGEWTALVDSGKRMALINGFAAGTVETLGIWGKEAYDLELWATVRDVPAGQALEFSHRLSLIRGLSGATASRDGMALNLDLKGTGVLGKDTPFEFDAEIGAIRALAGNATVELQRDGKAVRNMGGMPVIAPAGRAVTRTLTGDMRDLADGAYDLVLRFTPAGGAGLEARQPVIVARAAQDRQLQGLAAFAARVEEIKADCRAARAAAKPQAVVDALRRQAVQAALLLAEARALAEAGRAEEARAVEQVLRSLLSAKP